MGALRTATAIIVHSQFVRSVALANLLPDDIIEVIPYFVDRPSEPSGPSSGRTILFAGRIVRDKGLDVLVEALSLRGDSWSRCLVIGEGWDENRIRRLANRRGVGAKVVFLGPLPRKEVRDELGKAHVVVVPSRWPEPFGIIGLEAMAAGRPVVASNVGGIPEWLDDGRTGILVPPGDAKALAGALTVLLEDSSRAEQMGLEGWRQVERFSPDSHLRRLLSTYRRATGMRIRTLAGAGST